MADLLQTTQRVTFTSVATVLIPFGISFMNQNLWVGLAMVVLGVGALVLREVFKVVE